MRIRLLLAAVIVALVAGVVPATAGPAEHQQADVLTLPGLAPIDGASAKLTRTDSGLTVNVKTTGLAAGNAVTVWAVSFSNTENCDFGGLLPDGTVTLCGIGDDAAPDTGFQIQQLAGHVIGNGGNANFGGHVEIDNPRGAELHIAIADHGQLDPAQMPTQIMSPAQPVQIAFFVPTS